LIRGMTGSEPKPSHENRPEQQMTTTQEPTYGLIAGLRIGARSIRRYPVLGAAFLVAILSQGLLQAGMIWALREVLLSFSQPGGVSSAALLLSAIGVLALWLLRSAGVFAVDAFSARLGYRVEIEAMLQVLQKLLSLSIRFFDKSSQGDLVMASYYDLKGLRHVTFEVGRLALYVSQLGGLVAVAWLMSPKLTLIGIATVPLGLFPAYWFGREVSRHALGGRKELMSLNDSFLQVSSGIRTIKVNRAEGRLLQRARGIGHALHRHIVRQAQSMGLSRVMVESIAGFGLIVVLIVGGRDVAAGTMAWQSLLGLLIAIMAVYSPVVGLVQMYGGIRTVIPNLERIDRILGAVPEVQDRSDARRLSGAPSKIELREVSFAYEGQPVLERISATIWRGETIGIVGPTGAGKSTLVSLLLRFYDPSSGSILYDGTDLRELRHADLMDQCAMVFQDPFLFVDTIANNIRVGRPDAGMDDVIAASKAAYVHDEILQMEQGYDTVIGGPGGRGLSGGQRQRICIAAALLKNAPILFLDEATNNLDSIAEQKVQLAIDRLMKGRTCFVIAHRLSTLRNADRILVLERGRLVGFAPHNELLAGCETYRHQWVQGTQAMGARGDGMELSGPAAARRVGNANG
jgi:ATP-binding cassette, subfamily B, bacterial MsbA